MTAVEWLEQNLSITHYRNGDVIPQVTDPKEWAGLTTGAWCHYENDPANEEKYGKLYNWYAVNDPRGLAPHGYHVPTDEEWNILKPDAVYGGYRNYDDGTFGSIGYNGHWWSSTELNTNFAWSRHLFYFNCNVNRLNYYKKNGFSVRCLRDVELTDSLENKTEISDEEITKLANEHILYNDSKRQWVIEGMKLYREQLKQKQ